MEWWVDGRSGYEDAMEYGAAQQQKLCGEKGDFVIVTVPVGQSSDIDDMFCIVSHPDGQETRKPKSNLFRLF